MDNSTREHIGSRLGFILLSAGCAIGIGNVWKFPWMVGSHGGGLFVLIYLFFLLTLGVPVLAMEFAAGRAARASILSMHARLTPDRPAWRGHGLLGMAGCCLLMMFYTTVAGWMLLYFGKTAAGAFAGLDPTGVAAAFDRCLASPGQQLAGMVLVSTAGFAVCAASLQGGLERITKWMMLALLGLMALLAVHSVFLKNGLAGLSFYLKPDFSVLKAKGIVPVVTAAMNQAFFTLSIGIGSMAVFGSYIDRTRTLLGEAVNVAVLDTIVALLAGIIIFPACFAFGVRPDAGPGLVFVTLPNVFNAMPFGRLWGSLFFAFMTVAAFTTVLAVFENLIAGLREATGWSRGRAALAWALAMPVLSAPCAIGFNLLKDFHPFGGTTTVLDFEDFLVSDLALPVGALLFVIYCTSRRFGWGWEAFLAEVNIGCGIRLPAGTRRFLTWILPASILLILVMGIRARLN